ncbi:MAG: PA2778 family cysteine peptidase [Alcanivoracaceae bacterium]|nr:PA2778 family cysteine peptidase [Alcanivoracaceae bacterium]
MNITLLLALSGCQSLSQRPHQAGATQSASADMDVPFFAQEKYQCGPAALASVLSYAGVAITPEQLVDEVWLPKRHGSLAMELSAAARARGMLVYPVNTEAALFAELDAGHPVLIQQNLLFNWLPQWHFAVVVGYADSGDTLYLHSGREKKKTVDLPWFENHWRKADRVGFAVIPANQLPAHSTALTLATAIDDLSHSSQQPATEYWQLAANRYPHSAIILFGYGNALSRQANFINASTQYQSATKIKHDFHEAWNNLADTYKQLQCKEKALQAIHVALSLSPNNDLYLATQREINALDNEQKCLADDPSHN